MNGTGIFVGKKVKKRNAVAVFDSDCYEVGRKDIPKRIATNGEMPGLKNFMQAGDLIGREGGVVGIKNDISQFGG